MIEIYFLKSQGSFVIKQGKASIGTLQRHFKIGFNRAARIIDELCKAEQANILIIMATNIKLEDLALTFLLIN